MSEENGPFFSVSVKNNEEVRQLTERLLEVAEPGAVFSKPVKSGDYTLITASELSVALGSGYGYGEKTQGQPDNSGGGGGGGGMSAGRPVAVVSVGPDGVQVHPVIDRTKLGIALFSAVGSMLLAIVRMKK